MVRYLLLILLFVSAWLSEYPSLFRRFVEIEPKDPALLREFHVVLLAVFLPVVLVAGALCIVTAVQPSFELYAPFALWFELAYIMSFVLLRGIFDGVFSMSYRTAALRTAVPWCVSRISRTASCVRRSSVELVPYRKELFQRNTIVPSISRHSAAQTWVTS
jgi:hypothetical protein